ncbi:MAG: Putative branched-chain-amino-acid aminotransferase [Archaeoglobus fulgidus]|jgi:branched-chain amino acid aminotransferase|uniref:Branched-chain-amino-acid aminotransferase n=1 Tax=Archaeoglobus fulgidus TaxID=2234 RepID=A0A101DZN8_ARCFL|nr:branched-chain-amino-acid transaminase [Archaeoglobus fulgidus]KUJ92648.1 MAG: Putative branched-chain-amino-acid aminotransferase [Archaeoglobus fulgidus]KUK05867.1 MAG: Putative branched-chain-amino-acid aminotransferase [Archaeoglobus fulgidus]
MLYVYMDGEFVPENEAKVSIFDHGFLYGDGVFEGIRAYNGRVFRLKEHIDRLYDSAKAIDLEIPITKEEFMEIILETLRKNNLRDAYIRPIVTRGIGDLGLDPRKCQKPSIIVITKPWGKLYGDLYEKGLTAITVAVRRNSFDALPPNIKSLNYLNNILAKIEANAKGGDEAIFLDRNGYVSEGSGDNIFVVKNGAITTPPTINNLRGITREAVIEIINRLGIPFKETNIGLYDLYTADEVFVTGTAAEIAPIVVIDGRKIGDGKPGEITRKLMEEFSKLTESEGVPIYE